MEAFPPLKAITLAQHNALKPTGKSIRFTKLIKLLPGDDKGVLSDIFSKISITEHGIGTGKCYRIVKCVQTI